jgi:hypothetical protein
MAKMALGEILRPSNCHVSHFKNISILLFNVLKINKNNVIFFGGGGGGGLLPWGWWPKRKKKNNGFGGFSLWVGSATV